MPSAMVLFNCSSVHRHNDTTTFDNWDDEQSSDNVDLPSRPSPVLDELPPELRPVPLPSTHLPSGHYFHGQELGLRILQSTRCLAAIRDLVAEKSFEYAHVMRKAATKRIQTRSRSSIVKLNDQLTFCCRVYTWARAALVRLGAGESLLNRFRLLSKDHVKASTAILNPNIPGSSSLRLSWIWQTRAQGVASEAEPDLMRECEYPGLFLWMFLMFGCSSKSPL